jgi:hypothetical protein
MTTHQAPGPHDGRPKSVVVVNFPWGREFVWLTADSPIVTTQVGDEVVFREERWRVLRRENLGESLSLTLGVA